MSVTSFSRHSVWGLPLALSCLATGSHAGTLSLQVDIPQQSVAEYHKPYVAGWIEDGKGAATRNVFVWYDVKKRDNAGQKWLSDLRTWWRKSGRDLASTDGFSSATRAPGRQTLTLDTTSTASLKALPAGNYVFVVEAARENGGHDLVKMPFNWNPAKAATGAAKGAGELGDVRLNYKP
ncbi:MAG: DUF2271 domain-containing protein [Asticcacaulis sp.]